MQENLTDSYFPKLFPCLRSVLAMWLCCHSESDGKQLYFFLIGLFTLSQSCRTLH